jgi:hypothetical protein
LTSGEGHRHPGNKGSNIFGKPPVVSFAAFQLFSPRQVGFPNEALPVLHRAFPDRRGFIGPIGDIPKSLGFPPLLYNGVSAVQGLCG